MLGHPLAQVVARRQHVDHAGRKHSLRQFAHPEGGQRGVGRRLEDHRVASVERRAQGSQRQRGGRVPGRDDADDAQRPIVQLDAAPVILEEHLDRDFDAHHAVGQGGAPARIPPRTGRRACPARGSAVRPVRPCARAGGPGTAGSAPRAPRRTVRASRRTPAGRPATACSRCSRPAAGAMANTSSVAGSMTSMISSPATNWPSIVSAKSSWNCILAAVSAIEISPLHPFRPNRVGFARATILHRPGGR